MIRIKELKVHTTSEICSVCGYRYDTIMISKNDTLVCPKCVNHDLGSEGMRAVGTALQSGNPAHLFRPSESIELRYGILLNNRLWQRIPGELHADVIHRICRQLGEKGNHALKRKLMYVSVKMLVIHRDAVKQVLIPRFQELASPEGGYDPVQFSTYAFPLLLNCAPQSIEEQAVLHQMRQKLADDYVAFFSQDLGGTLVPRFSPNEMLGLLEYALWYYEEGRSDLATFRDARAALVADILDDQFKADAMKHIYACYVKPVLAEVQPYLPSPLLTGKSKRDLARIIGYVFTIPELFQSSMKTRPASFRSLLPKLILRGEHIPVSDLSAGDIKIPKDFGYKRTSFLERYFPLLTHNHSYFSYYSSNETCFFPESILSTLRRTYAAYTACELSSSPVPPSEGVVEGFSSCMQIYSLLTGYRQSVGVRFSKNGKSILKTTLKECQNLASIPEPFETDRNLAYMRTELLLKLFELYHPEETSSQGIAFVEDLYRQIRAPFLPDALLLESLLPHLEMLSEGHFNTYGFLNPAFGMTYILENLEEGQWYAAEHIMNHLVSMDLPGTPCLASFLRGELLSAGEGRLSDITQRGKIRVTMRNYLQLVQVPFVKMVLFLLNTMGLIDIYYEPIENEYHLKNKTYLTGFDGIAGCRLTSLGLKVFGRSDAYEEEVPEDESYFILDEHMLLVTLKGEDPVRRIFLEKVGKKTGNIFYVIDVKSFTKDCASTYELESRVDSFIRLFEGEELPVNWQAFFDEILEKNKILEVEYQAHIPLVVDEMVKQLIREDGKIGEYVKIAEGNRVFVPLNKYAAVRTFLKKHGYILPDFLESV